MRNYTLHISHNEHCDSTGGWKGSYSDRSREYMTWNIARILATDLASPKMLVFNNTLENLRFITCGERGSESFLLHDLMSAYDVISWLSIVIFVLVVSKFLSLISKPVPFLLSLIYLFKVLIEQGDPFPNQLLRRDSFRWTIAGILAAATVLSNGYKNTNVYNIISNRNRLPFHTFDQLQNDQVKSHTSPKNVMYSFHDARGLEKGLERISLDKEAKTIYQVDWDGKHRIQIRVSKYLKIYAADDFLHSDTGKDKNLSDTKMLWNSTKLHHNTKELLLRPVNNLIDAMSKNQTFNLGLKTSGELTESTRLKSMYSSIRENFVIEAISQCKKAAFIIDEPKCQYYARFIEQKWNKAVDIGTEVYFPTKIGINFAGLVGLSFLRRLGGMQQSGIVEWWTHILKSSFIGRKEKELQPVKISGNVLVIFSLLLLGEIVGVLVFTFEIQYIIVFKAGLLIRLIVRVFYSAKSLCELFRSFVKRICRQYCYKIRSRYKKVLSVYTEKS